MHTTQQQARTRTASRKHRGQGLTEYIIIVALIAIAAIVAVGTFGGVVQDSFISMATSLAGEGGQEVETDATVTGAPTDLQTYQAGN